MKSRIIGVGQCGTRVVQDILNKLFPSVPESREIRATPSGTELTIKLKRVQESFAQAFLKGAAQLQAYIQRSLVSERPDLFVMDGNSDNAVVKGMVFLGDSLKVHLFCKAVELQFRPGGCSVSSIGYSLFKKVEEDADPSYKEATEIDEEIDIYFVIASAAGGTGSGGMIVLNESLTRDRSNPSGVINILVLPSPGGLAHRQAWNTGRALHWLGKKKEADATILVSNFDDDPDAQAAVNRYVAELMVRSSNFYYEGNVPPLGTDLDLKDFKGFLLNSMIAVSMSSLDPSTDTLDPELLLDDLFRYSAPEAQAGGSIPRGLSIDIDLDQEKANFEAALLVVGVPKSASNQALRGFVRSLREGVRARTNDSVDVQIFSYGSISHLEITAFFQFRDTSALQPVRECLEVYRESLDGHSGEHELFTYLLSPEAADVAPRNLLRLAKAVQDESDGTLGADQVLEHMRLLESRGRAPAGAP